MNMHWTSIVIIQSYIVVVYTSEISKSKPGRQSYVSVDHDASKAFDGDPLTYSSTFGGDDAVGGWIQVDTGGIYNIQRVAIINVLGSDSQYLVNFQVLVGTTNQIISDWTSCYVYAGMPPLQPGVTYSSDCKQQLTLGRYVTVQKHDGPYKGVIVAAEIMVYGTPNIPATNLVTNGSNVRQSSEDYQEFKATRAIDGDLYTCSFTATESVSRRNISGWWQVDLGESMRVTGCLLANVRKEYFEPFSYMKSFAVLVSNDSKTDFNENNLCHLYNSSQYLQTVLYLPCAKFGLIGRYVTVLNMISGELLDRKDALSLCEFNVLYSIEDLESQMTSTVTTTIISTSTPIETTTITPTVTTTVTTERTTMQSTTTTIIFSSSTLTTDQSSTTTFPIPTTTVSTLETTKSNTTISIKYFPTTDSSSISSTTQKTPNSESSRSPTTVANTPHLSTYHLSTGDQSSTFTRTEDISPHILITTFNNSTYGYESIVDDNRNLRLGLGIGLGLGLGLLLLLAILLIIIYCCVKKRKTAKEEITQNGKDPEKVSPLSTIYVHPRTRLGSPRNNAFDGVDFSYVPDLSWQQGSEA